LKSIGADLALVELLVATHWHDDHVRGFSDLVFECPNAVVCLSSFVTNAEFMATVYANDERPLTNVTSGVREMRRVLDACKEGNRRVVRAAADKRILHIDNLTHSKAVEIWSLSPGDNAYERFMHSLARLFPNAGEQKRRIAAIGPNDCSVVILVSIGELSILLGADLEEEGAKGWSAVLASSGRPNYKSSFFKVPHHGSRNAHHPDVWSNMLVESPIFAVAPYDRGRKLPSPEDINRLLGMSGNGYLTASPVGKAIKRGGTVGKILSDMGIKVLSATSPVGHVRVRAEGSNFDCFGDVELFDGAMRIAPTEGHKASSS
jgi:hypothetical protein